MATLALTPHLQGVNATGAGVEFRGAGPVHSVRRSHWPTFRKGRSTMNTKLAIPFLAVLALAQGCIVHGPPGPSAGDVTFSWTFYGQSCSAAGVANVHINIPGETLENGGVYPCVSNSYQGIVLHNFAGGSYTYTIEGLDTGGYTIYTGAGAFDIDGDAMEQVDLTPYGQP